MRSRITFQSDPGYFTGSLTFAVLLMVTACGGMRLLFETGRIELFVIMLVVDGVIAIVVGVIVEHRFGTFFKKAPKPPGPAPQGVDELVAVRAMGPRQCPYCETSILPSMVTCPKCGRRII